METKKQIIIS